MRHLLLGLIATAFAAPSLAIAQSETTVASHDGFELTGDYYAAENAEKAVLLLHQCNMERHSWDALAALLHGRGMAVMTLDFRGYGDSKGGKFTNNRSGRAHFADDTDAAFVHFRGLVGADANYAVMGASCGGNMAFSASTRHEEISAIVLLSSGLTQDQSVWDLFGERSDLAVLSIAAKDDGRAHRDEKRAVDVSKSDQSKLISYSGSLHGVPLFQQDPSLPRQIADWLDIQLSN